MKPTIGRLVHYRGAQDHKAAPAIITDVAHNHLSLTVFGRTGQAYVLVPVEPVATTAEVGWCWPTREDSK